MKYKICFWDVYGTLIQAKRGDLGSLVRRHDELKAVFERTVSNFSLSVSGETLQEGFITGIRSELERRRADGIAHPEVRIEEIWLQLLDGVTLNQAREIALFFEREANPKQLQPHAFEVLTTLKQRGVGQGIISNAQFYTPIELSGLLRDESACEVCTYESIFDPQFIFFSHEMGVAKPDPAPFRGAVEVAAAKGIQPGECVMCGDSPANDVRPAQSVGFGAVLYAPDGIPRSEIEADKTITDLRQLLEIV